MSFNSSRLDKVVKGAKTPNSTLKTMTASKQRSLLNSFSNVGSIEERLFQRKQLCDRLWDPPVSCQRLNLSGGDDTSYQLYFPLELNVVDYFGRIMNLLGLILRKYCKVSNNDNVDSVESTSDISKLNIFLRILFSGEYIIATDFNLQSDIECFQHVYSSHIDLQNAVGVIVSFHSHLHLVLKNNFTTSSKLLDISFVFNAANTISSFYMIPASSKIRSDLRTLQEQCQLHSTFKDQRLSGMNWSWPSRDVIAVDKLSQLSALKITSTNAPPIFNLNSELDEEQKTDGNVGDLLMQRYTELTAQINSLFQPNTSAHVQLLHRMVCIVEDLGVLMNAVSSDGDFSEAQRLRVLGAAVDHTVSHQGLALLDSVKVMSNQAVELGAELQKGSAVAHREHKDFATAHQLDSAAKDLLRIVPLLKGLVAEFSLFSQPDAVRRIGDEGSAFVTANYLFTSLHGDGQTLSGLVIKAQAGSVLLSIKEWPGFSTLSDRGDVGGGGMSSNEMASPGRSLSNQQHSVASPMSRSGGFSSGLYSSPESPKGQQYINQQQQFNSTLRSTSSTFLAASSPFGRTAGSNSDLFAQTGSSSVDGGEKYSTMGFSPTILAILTSFQEFQVQLTALLDPQSSALTILLCRLLGMRSDLSILIERNRHVGLYDEQDRLAALHQAVEDSIDSDEQQDITDGAGSGEATNDLLVNSCGRGRRRIDNIQLIVSQVHSAVKELQRLAVKAKSQRDFSGSAALSNMAADLSEQLQQVETAVSPFSILEADDEERTEATVFNSFNRSTSLVAVEDSLSERVSREGTGFITSDFLFHFSSADGHSIGSLAIISGAGAILRHIRSSWPDLQALDGVAIRASLDRDGMMSPGGATDSLVDFRDANQLRQLGFDPSALRLAGFGDSDILTAGFTAAQLHHAGFGTESMRATGLSERTIRTIGFKVENQLEVLQELFSVTNGKGWKVAAGYERLSKVVHPQDGRQQSGSQVTPSPSKLNSLEKVLSGLHGVTCEQTGRRQGGSLGVGAATHTIDIYRLCLPANNLTGRLPDSLGWLDTLRHLVLTDNSLSGCIPASIGLLVRLESLCLSNNLLEGEIPRSLKNCQALVILRLENNRLEGSIPAVLGQLPSIRRIDLSCNRLTGSVPGKLAQAAGSLRELLLHSNQLTGIIPEALGSLVNLTSCYLQNNAFSGSVPPSFANLSRLSCLNLQNNPGLFVERLLLQRSLPKCRIIL